VTEEEYLHERVETAEIRSEFLQRIFILGVVNSIAIVLGLVGGAIFYGSIHSITNDTNENTVQITKITARIDSCTNTNGKCFKDFRRRNSGQVAAINKYVLYVNQCTDRLNGDRAIADCVIRKIQEGFPKDGPVTR